MTTPTPTYDPKVPLPENNLAQSQVDFFNNFMVLYNAFGLNHVALDAASNAGNHNVIQLSEQTSDPLTNVSEVSVYVKSAAGQTDQIFLKYPNGTGFQFSSYQIYALTAAPSQIQYFTFLPGRVIVYFGLVTPSALPPGQLPAVYFPPFIAKNIISINLCLSGGTSTISPWISLPTPTPQGFIQNAFLNGPIAGLSFYYIAMANI